MPNSDRPMSLDAVLDLERREVLELLEDRAEGGNTAERVRSSSPLTATPVSPIRSMLDIEEEIETPTASAAPTTQAPVRSMLDIGEPAPKDPSHAPPLSLSTVRTPSPRSPTLPAGQQLRLQPGASPQRRRSDAGLKARPGDRTSEYQFSGIYHPSSGQAKRGSQAGKRFSGSSEGTRGPEKGRLGSPSSSSQSRWSARSRSPAAALSPRLNMAVPKNGKLVDMSSAYRRLSDANLALSSGSLAHLPSHKRSQEAGEGRLIKDYLGPDGEHLDSSEEDEAHSSDDEDRGRKTAPRPLEADASDGSQSLQPPSSLEKGRRASLSLLAAAEAERSEVASKQPEYKYRSLLSGGPEIKVTASGEEVAKPSKSAAIHPHTSYDSKTPLDSDEEADVDDIRRAQKLAFSMTNVMQNPEAHRAIRIIYRGEYSKIVKEDDKDKHRFRKYMAATDLSEESTHALEWAIGTVLRDGDTLIAINCVDEETGTVTDESALVPDEPKAMREQATAINTVMSSKAMPPAAAAATTTTATTALGELKRATALHLRAESTTGTPRSSPGATPRGKRHRAAMEERQRRVQGITDRVVRLLRKTRLQVRVMVEVLHCKSPRHLINEVIDLVNPTLVVIGSRGRSALKGVILGSFSNYLVTKSSVPVMVARKRLRKQSKFKRTPVRQVNNLSNPVARSLAHARID